MRQVRLRGDCFISVPGFIAAYQNDYVFPEERDRVVKTMLSIFDALTESDVHQILSKACPQKADGADLLVDLKEPGDE